MDNLEQLEALIRELNEVRTKADYHELQAGEWKKQERELVEHKIPELMESVGVDKLTTTSGLNVEIQQQVFARIPEAKKQEAYDWLIDHNEGGMIKEEVIQRVHPMTLKSWVRGKLEEGALIPEDLFGVYIKKVAKIR